MTDNVIEIRNLRKEFGNTIAFEDLNLTIKRGEMFGLVGPDGAGKTTTIRILCGIIPPSSGEVKVLDCDVSRELHRIKPNIGYLSQRFSLYGDLTVDENIEFFAEIHGVKDYRTRCEELLAFTRLTPFRKRLAEKLSGGMKQKLALVCTLIHTPQLLFLDEPTTGVDPVSRRDFWKILSNLLKAGITIILTTPYLDEAERCTRVGMMNKGRLMVVDSPHNIKQLLPWKVVEMVCGEINRSHKIIRKSFHYELQAFGDRLNLMLNNVEKELPLVLEVLRKENIEIANWRTIPPSMENVFIYFMKSN